MCGNGTVQTTWFSLQTGTKGNQMEEELTIVLTFSVGTIIHGMILGVLQKNHTHFMLFVKNKVVDISLNEEISDFLTQLQVLILIPVKPFICLCKRESCRFC